MKKKAFLLGILAALMLPLAGCAQKVKEYRLQVVETLPHDRGAYTQGLFFHNGDLYESCGQYGSSSFRKVELKTGKDLRRLNFDAKYFVEGSCVLNNLLYIMLAAMPTQLPLWAMRVSSRSWAVERSAAVAGVDLLESRKGSWIRGCTMGGASFGVLVIVA